MSQHTGPKQRCVSRSLSIFSTLAAVIAVGTVTAAGAGSPGMSLDVVGTGERDLPAATTDVWTHERYAYTGTFNEPCGGDPEAGVWVWDVHNPNKVELVGVIPSPPGSRSDDVKVAAMNSGDILVHSNSPCASGGPGGFEIYDVNDPSAPIHLASVQTDDINLFLRNNFGFVDFPVVNLFLFTQGERDYVAAVVASELGNLQIFDISDPTSPTLVGYWGAEQLFLPGVGDWVNLTDFAVILDVDAYLFGGFGASQNRFVDDVTVSSDGLTAYLSNWDAGLVLLDISDPTSPALISVAIDPSVGDGEVNSSSAWPSEDGTIVVEGEDDPFAWQAAVLPSNWTLDSTFPGDPTIPAVGIATADGDLLEARPTGEIGTVDGSSIEITGGTLAGTTFAAYEPTTAAGSPTFASTGPVAGELVWIGRACFSTLGDPLLNAGALDPGDIAVARRGGCNFEEKAAAAASLGAAAVVIANTGQSTDWGGLRIWDMSDPASPVLASTFDTACSAATSPGGPCSLGDSYTAQNVVVETRGNRTLAYVSWSADGVLVVDVTDPYNPVGFAGHAAAGEDYWGVSKAPNSPWIFASDRNGGLRVLKQHGGGRGN